MAYEQYGTHTVAWSTRWRPVRVATVAAQLLPHRARGSRALAAREKRRAPHFRPCRGLPKDTGHVEMVVRQRAELDLLRTLLVSQRLCVLPKLSAYE